MFYESAPIQIRFRYEYSEESAQFGWNRARIHYDQQNNIRSCCTKVKESITNELRICRMQHELGTNLQKSAKNRDDSRDFSHKSYKKGPSMLWGGGGGGAQFQNECFS